MKWDQQKFNKFYPNISKIRKKFKQHPINFKNYTAHPHDMVHVPAKFRENTAMGFELQFETKRDGQTNEQTDGWTGGFQYLRPGASALREIIIYYQSPTRK